ncbi:MAG: filamentation induced by cAMP protein Fic [Proteobacteria bacterium]|nr:filamentation induced by cAMP protein Fic [Pseudomonadota bacterium]
MRETGTYITSTTLGESVRAFVPHPLPPVAPALSSADFDAPNHAAELALARLSGVSGLVPLYARIGRDILLWQDAQCWGAKAISRAGRARCWNST